MQTASSKLGCLKAGRMLKLRIGTVLVLCKMLINYINKSMKGSQMKYRIRLNSFGESSKVASEFIYLFYVNVQICKSTKLGAWKIQINLTFELNLTKKYQVETE